MCCISTSLYIIVILKKSVGAVLGILFNLKAIQYFKEGISSNVSSLFYTDMLIEARFLTFQAIISYKGSTYILTFMLAN